MFSYVLNVVILGCVFVKMLYIECDFIISFRYFLHLNSERPEYGF